MGADIVWFDDVRCRRRRVRRVAEMTTLAIAICLPDQRMIAGGLKWADGRLFTADRLDGFGAFHGESDIAHKNVVGFFFRRNGFDLTIGSDSAEPLHWNEDTCGN